MGGYTKDQLLAYLKELQVDFVSYDHPVVLTVEAQAKYVGHLGAGLSKNLFLKDKKHRYYVLCALADAVVDLKVLSQRLGLGKGGLRMAPEESLQEILQVPLGCVTPFALINESARGAALLLDKGFKQQDKCLFHPLSNDMTISLSTSSLDKFLAAIGRKTAYIDLEATVLGGKEFTPDLADLVPSSVPALSDIVEKLDLAQLSFANTSPEKKLINTIDACQPDVSKKPDLSESTAVAKSRSIVDRSAEATDVGNFIKEVIEKTATVLFEVTKSSSDKDVDSSVLDVVKRRIALDIESRAMILLNASYTEGYHAGVQSTTRSARANR